MCCRHGLSVSRTIEGRCRRPRPKTSQKDPTSASDRGLTRHLVSGVGRAFILAFQWPRAIQKSVRKYMRRNCFFSHKKIYMRETRDERHTRTRPASDQHGTRAGCNMHFGLREQACRISHHQRATAQCCARALAMGATASQRFSCGSYASTELFAAGPSPPAAQSFPRTDVREK